MGLEKSSLFCYNTGLMKNFFSSLSKRLKNMFSGLWNALKKNIDKRPFVSFFVLMAGLMAAVVIGNQLRKPPAEVAQTVPAPKVVNVYQIGATPNIQMQAKIEKSGVIQIVAQSAGIVQKITKNEGDHVKRGTQLFSLSTNYQGGNISSLNRQLAQKNFSFLSDNYDTQKGAIDLQRQLAQKAETQTEQLRSITRDSFGQTQSLIDLDNDIVASMDAQINNLQNAPDASSAAALLQTKEAKAQILNGLNAVQQALNSNKYLADDNNQPAQIAGMQRDLTLKQLDIQDRMIDLNKDLSQINLRITQVNESLMYPASPCPGTVERIYVKVGQSVTPGTPLAEIRGDMNTATAVVLVAPEVASTISTTVPSTLMIGGQKLQLYPRSISQEPTDNGLNSVIYTIPEGYASQFTNNSDVQMSLPVGTNYARAETPYVPLDAIYQTPDTSSVLVIEKNVAKNRIIKLGNVSGEYVQVLSGVNPGDQVITDRNVIEGDAVVSATTPAPTVSAISTATSSAQTSTASAAVVRKK